MTGPGYDPKMLRLLPIVGPEIAQASAGKEVERRPLWRLSCAVLYFRPPHPPHAADKSPGLRTLLESSRGRSMSITDLLDQQNAVIRIADYRDPALMAAVVTLGGGTDIGFKHDIMRRLDLFGEHPARVFSRAEGLDTTDAAPDGTQHHVLLAPAEPWPDQLADQNGKNGAELWVPPMRLVAGRIPLRVEISAELMRTLGGDGATGELFGGLPAFPANDALAADLTPDGIEFRLGLPDPMADLAQTPAAPDLRRVARLQPLRGEDAKKQTRLGLALVDTTDDVRMDQAFAGAFAQLRRDGSPLRFDYDPRPEVAPLWWPLETHRDGDGHPVLNFPGDADTWRAEMRGEVFRMRLTTGRAEGTFADAAARANIAEDAALQLERDANGTRLAMPSDAPDRDDSDAVQAEAAWGRLTDGRFALVSARLHGRTGGEPAEVHAALHEAADRLGARYAARGLLRPGQTRAPHLFLPIVEGVAQIETPKDSPSLRAGGGAAVPPPAGGSLAGAVVLELPRKDLAPVRLEIDAVAGHEIAVRWPRRDPIDTIPKVEAIASVTEVKVALRGLRGVVRNLMWLCEESPDADRALPTGRIAPAATGPMPLYLGAAVESDATLKLEWNAENDPTLAWTAVLTGTDGVAGTKVPPPAARLWTRHPYLPLISAAEMLRSGDAAAEPSPTRDLFPSDLEGALLLNGAPGSPLPSIYPPMEAAARQPRVRSLWRRASEATGTQWGAPEIALVAPSAPGLEFRQTRDAAGGFTDGFAFETALRLDLPGLDELFAVAAPPRPARPEATDDGASTPKKADPPATALDLSLLEEELWRRREFAQAMTRTVAARATQWFALNASAPEVHGLVEPWTATAEVKFQRSWTGHDGALAQAPLGGWRVEWHAPAVGYAPAPELFTGDAAIAGLGGAEPAGFAQEGDALVRMDGGPIRIAGFAAALFPDAEAGRDVDGAGLTLQRRSEASAWPSGLGAAATGRVWRAAGVRNVGTVGADRRLVTFSAPVKASLMQDGEELLFWIRDLPLERAEGAWRFDAAKVGPERALGADPTLFDRENAAAAIYEWRLHAVEGEGWGFGLNGLYLRPLRLLSVTDEGFRTLCAADLFDATKASNARFGDDRPYRTGNLVRLDFKWTETGAQLTVATRVRLKAGAEQVSQAALEVDSTPLRFPVDYTHAPVDFTHADAAAGTAGRERADLLILPEAEGKLPLADGDLKVALRLRLFGRRMRVDGGRLEPGADANGDLVLHLSFGAVDQEALAGYGASLQQMVLELPARRGAPGKLSMKFAVGAPLRIPEATGGAAAQDAMLIERRSDGALTWLAAEIPAAGKRALHVDHTRGALNLRATERDPGDGRWKAQDWIEPIRGFVYRAPQYEILLDMFFPLDDDDERGSPQELPVTFVPLALNASGRLIAGDGHVGAALRTELRTERGALVATALMLDLPRDGLEGAADGWLESGVAWPVEGLELGDPPTPGRAQRFETHADPAALRHEVRPAVIGWRVPLDALGKVDGPGAKIGIARRIDILAPVEHRLTPKAGGEAVLTFTTLDRISLLDASKIAAIAKEMLEVEEVRTPRSLPHGFAPRYTHSDLRKLDPADEAAQEKRTPHAGIARPSIAGGGFRDLKLLEDLKDADGGGGLLVFGAAPLALLDDKGCALSFGAPWVTASARAAAPAALKTLQDFSTHRGWVASDVDLDPFQFELAPNAGVRGPRLLSDPPRRAADLLAALSTAVFRTSADANAWTATEVLEPALLDAEELGAAANASVKPLPSTDIELTEWPLFLRALVGLREVLQRLGGAQAVRPPWDVVTLLRPGDGDRQGGLAAVRFRAPASLDPKAGSDEAMRLISDFFADGAPAELVVYNSAEGLRRVAPAPDTGASPGTEAARSAALREAAEALSARPRAILVERRDADGFRLSRAAVVPGREAEELGARAMKLRDGAQTVHASSALGWPETPFDGSDAGDLTLDAGPDVPVLSAEAGLSARVAGFGLRPKAAPKGAPTVWFVSASRSRFLRRRDDADPVSGAAAAPAPRHMTAPSVRARAPAEAALRAALDKVAGEGAFVESAPIMPAGLLRGAVGRRPGAMEIGYDALMTDRGGRFLLDAEVPQLGVSATLGPGILRILRCPRSTALPRGVPFARSRRTFVSGADRRDGALRECLVLEGAHVAMRQPEDAGDRRLLAELLTPTVDTILKAPETADAVLWRSGVRVRTTLAVEAGDAAPKLMPFLAETGFFAKIAGDGAQEHASLGARLVAGDLRIAFNSVEWTRERETLTLFFPLKQIEAEALAEAARTEAADLRVALQLTSGKKSKKSDAVFDDSSGKAALAAEGGGPKGWLPDPDDLLELPVLAAPLDRPTLSYATRTAIFGDPAYDRSLASRPQSAERGLKSAGTAHAFLFGLDRASHNLGAAIHLAAGEVERSQSGAEWAFKPTPEQMAADDEKAESDREFWTFEISVQLQPYDPGAPIPPSARPLRLAKEGAPASPQGDVGYKFESQRRYAIPVAALYESVRKDGAWTLGPPAALRPGDRLVLRVRVSRGTDQMDLRAETLLTSEPSVGPPEAVYSLLDVIGDKAPLRARVALHAPGPMPRRVEFPDFLGDLLDGHIRRRALFIWHEVDLSPLDATTRHATLVKFDRSGGGQLPMNRSDFEPSLETPAGGGGGA